MRKRQLQLPGLSPAPPGGRSDHRARRDYAATEFMRAMKRHGFAAVCGGTRFMDLESRQTFDGIWRREPLRLHRRATLASILRARKQKAEDARMRPRTQEQRAAASVRMLAYWRRRRLVAAAQHDPDLARDVATLDILCNRYGLSFPVEVLENVVRTGCQNRVRIAEEKC